MNYEKIAWVYFVECPGGDIKIGTIVKHRFVQRMNELWRKHGTICVIGVIEGGRKKEAELHDMFHKYRRRSTKTHYRVYTEYFEPSITLYEYIRCNSLDLGQFKEYRGRRRTHDYFGFEQESKNAPR